jgi:HlyD family secretion protein
MKVSIDATPAQSRQLRQQMATPEDSLSYELGKAVQELPPLYTRLLAATISVITIGTIGWAQFSKIDEVAVAQGKMIPSTEVRPLRALTVGSVSNTKVKVGDRVKKGQILAELDPGSVETSAVALDSEVAKIKEEITRLESENQGRVTGGTVEQNQLLLARQRELQEKQSSAVSEANRQVSVINAAQAQLERFQENLASGRNTLANAQKTRADAKANLEIALERQKRLKSLEDSGAVPHLEILNSAAQANQANQQLVAADNQINEAENQLVSLDKRIDEARDQVTQAERALDSAKSNAQVLQPQRQGEVLTQLTQRRSELTRKLGELEVAKKQKSERETVKAPFDGVVYNVKVTQGPVQQGEELLSILPENQDLIMEVKVMNQDVGFIHPGQDVKVKLATFPYQEFGILKGKVLDVSPDAVVEKDENGRPAGPVFLTRVKLTEKSSVVVRGQDVPLTPGMAGTADIVTRPKTILSFVLEPVTKKFNEAFSSR